jgi:pimeloyl-ACP methyl ester carboxylesterase
MRTPQGRHVLLCLAVAALVGAFAAVGGHRASAEPVAAQGDFAGLIDIGGRRIYLDCRGTGSPTVVLEAGYRSSARLWSEDLRQGEAPRTAVLAGVAGFTRVCAYDRPGTVAPLKDDVRPSRSDPVPQPRTAPTRLSTSTHCCARPASRAPTSSPATRWAVYSCGFTPARTLVTLSGSSSSTPIPKGWRRC